MISDWLMFKAVTQIGGAISGLFGGGGGMGTWEYMQHGGWIREPILGVGQSGQRYLFGEAGSELVTLAGALGRREETINLYLVDERAKAPIPTRNDIVLVVSDDIQREGVIRKTIKRFG